MNRLPGPPRNRVAVLVRRAALICLMSSGCVNTGERTESSLVIRDVTVIPMDSERVLTDWTVVVGHDRIVSMGPVGEVAIPPDAHVIDGRGRYLMPGLTDLHVHVERDYELPLYLARGVTTVLNLKGRSWHLGLRERLESGEVIGPRLFSCGPYVQNVEDPVLAQQSVEEIPAAGYDCVKIKGDWSESAYLSAVEAATARDIMLIGHAPRNQPFSLVLRGGYQRIAHLEELVYTTSELDRYIDGYRTWTGDLPRDGPATELEPAVRDLARATRAAGIWIVPTQVVIDHYLQRNKDFEALYDRSYMRYLDPIARRRWRSAEQGDRAARFLQQVRLQELMLRTFAAEGVKLALGTDAETDGQLMTMPGWSAHEELRLMVRAGLSPYAALRTATANAAEFLGEEMEGIVRPGSRANLLLLNRNPLEDVSNTSTIIGVVLNGRWFPHDSLAAMLWAVERAHEPLERRVAAVDSLLVAHGPEAAARAFIEGGRDSIVAGYLEAAINTIGYRQLGAGQTDSATAAFRVNAETFPESANAHDSLGEAYLAVGDTAQAIHEYRRALALQPDFTNAKRMLERIGADP